MQNNPLQDAINELLALNQFGRHSEMEERAKALLKRFPGTPVLRELLGMALAAQQRYADALPYFQRAVRDQPEDPLFWDNLAFCQIQLGDLSAAEADLREATARHPGSVSTWGMLANTLLSLDRQDDAHAALDRILALQPDDPHAHFLMGRIAAGRRRWAEAELHLRKVAALSPEVGAAHNELGLVLQAQGHLEEAEASFRRALANDGDNPAGLTNLALVLGAMSRQSDAAEAARAALRLLRRDGVSGDTIGMFDSAANLLDAAGSTEEALAIYKAMFASQRQPLRAVWAIYAARRACDWDFAAMLEPEACRVAAIGEAIDDSAPWRLLAIAGAGPAVQSAAARKCAAQVAADAIPAMRSGAPRQSGRLRIGYLSGDFYSHPTSHLMVGVVERHDRDRFEVVACDFTPAVSDDYRSRFEAAFERMVPIAQLPDQAAAQRIADDGIDILVDLVGWTRRARPGVLAARPAPLQVQWLGYPGTTGAPWIDYVVADEVLIRKGEELDYSEKIIRLPNT
jgi:predicted O-linked N-acetylglucosamine transferase (SPINDLY family)